MSVYFDFSNFPELVLQRFRKTEEKGFLAKFKFACQRRMHRLNHDWCFEVSNYSIQKLNGIIKIPATHASQELCTDGASMPMPWIFSAITFGIARPTGAMLLPSLVHDFAYIHGYVLVSKDGGNSYVETKLTREEADMLFKDMLTQITQLSSISTLGWMVLRLGWWFVDYPGESQANPPFKDVAILVIGLIGLVLLFFLMSKELIALLACGYICLWIFLFKKRSDSSI